MYIYIQTKSISLYHLIFVHYEINRSYLNYNIRAQYIPFKLHTYIYTTFYTHRYTITSQHS